MKSKTNHIKKKKQKTIKESQNSLTDFTGYNQRKKKKLITQNYMNSIKVLYSCKMWFLELLQILQARGTVRHTIASQVFTPEQVKILYIRTISTNSVKSFISQCGESKFQVLQIQLSHFYRNCMSINIPIQIGRVFLQIGLRHEPRVL